MNSAPHRYLHSEGAGFTLPTLTKMSLYDLMSQFWQLNDEQAFTAKETRLYFYLLNQFNSARWAAKIYRKTTQICADLSADKNTVNGARAALEARGLVFYQAGNPGASAVWSLTAEVKNSPVDNSERFEVEVKNSLQSQTNPAERFEVEVKNSPTYKEEEKILLEDKEKTLPPAATAASAGPEKKTATLLPTETQRPASHTRGAAADVPTSLPGGKAKPVGPRGWAYDPAAIADNLRLPFASPEFLAAWVTYRTYREEQKHRRLTGGLMEQQQLDKLAQLAAGEEASALALVAQTIAKGWQDFYPLDKPRTHASAIPTPKPGAARHHVPVVTSYGKL